ncbi:MAG TPA: hypothetical protein VJ853_09395 [Thermoanaerobaculia bacterium]|nr:hypothetical protein [Thermoanaerobaculia bacterium]
MLPLLAPLLSIVLGPEIPLGAPRIASAPYTQTLSSVASNGRDFLALWSDQRNLLDPNQPPKYPALYDGRIDASGQPVNATGHKLFDSAVGRMTWTGSSYLLVYTLANGHSFAQRLKDDGAPAGDASELAIGGPPLAMASNGSNVLLIHTSVYNVGADVSLLDKNGAILTTQLTAPIERVGQPFVLPGGDYAFVTLRTSCDGIGPCVRNVWLITVAAKDGTVTETRLFETSQWSQASATASTDGDILVAVEEDQEPALRTASYSIVRRDGAVVVPTAMIETEDANSASGIATPSVGWDGREFLVTLQWPSTDERTIALQAFRIAANGVRIDSQALQLDTMPYSTIDPPQFAASATAQLIAWNNLIVTNGDVFVRSATSFDELTTAPAHDITLANDAQRFPQADSAGLVVWIEDPAAPSVHAATPDGLDAVILEGNAGNMSPAAVARGSLSHLVVWRRELNPLQIVGRLVGSDGRPENPTFVIATEPDANIAWPYDREDVAVTSNGRGAYLVAWIGADSEVHAARVSEGGAVVDPAPLSVSSTVPFPEAAIAPRIVRTPDGFLVSWIQLRYCGCLFSPPLPPTSTLYTAVVGDDGVVGQAQAVWNGGSTDELTLRRIADDAIVAMWRDLDDTPNYTCINRMMLKGDGSSSSAVGPVVCRTSILNTASIGSFDAAADGSTLVVAWTETPAQTITAQRIDPRTLSASDAPVQVNPAGTRADAPSIVATTGGLAIAYARVADVSRIFVRNLQAGVPRRRASR